MIGNEQLLERLDLLSDGERAVLRRAAGQPLSRADGRALQALFRVMPRDIAFRKNNNEYAQWFAAITIACLWRLDEVRSNDSFARLLRNYAIVHESVSMDSRMRAVLDARWEDDGYLAGKLARLARMLRAEDRQRMPDIGQLLDDLQKWNWDNRSVQLRWAREYYLIDKEEATDAD